MTIKSAPYFWVVCDGCGARAEYGDFSAMDSEGDAISYAIDSDWTKQGERHHCPDCPRIADCERCGKDAGPEPMERDDHCRACWDSLEPVTFTFPHGTQVTVDRDGTVLHPETTP